MNKFLILHPNDNVGVALQDLIKGEKLKVGDQIIEMQENVEAKHKFALHNFKIDDQIIMYNFLVGKCKQNIEKGAWINTFNIKHAAADFSLEESEYVWENKPNISKWENKTFLGYERLNGEVGTANYWLLIPLVFCENSNITKLFTALKDSLGYSESNMLTEKANNLIKNLNVSEEAFLDIETAAYPTETKKRIFENIDGIQVLNHQMGCGGTRTDANALCALLAGYINNPNVAGATVLSLGCQNAQVSILEQEIFKRDLNFSKPLIILEQQEEGTENQLLDKALKKTLMGLKKANEIKRKPFPISKLTIGLECGGSDGFSGISANPVLGHISDLMAALKGRVILSEFPELCGVEQELINRCADKEIASKFISLMRSYESLAQKSGTSFSMNPSPGNIKDGLITDAIKSAGAAKKGGSSIITDVLDYPEKVTKEGLTLLCTPGNDVESTTAEAAAGANIILFTTGLGTPTGNPVVPVIKVASNNKLAQKMPDIIDFNAGLIIDGEKSIEEMGEELLELIIKVASGEISTKATLNNQFDFIPWKRGVSL